MEPIKIDLHIHSAASIKKDSEGLIKESRKENLSTLVGKLECYGINMMAITDHDAFDYSLYEELKKEEEKDNCIKKVLPGIEFTVTFERFKKEGSRCKPVHVIAIFDDRDKEKVKLIQKIIENHEYDNDEKNAFKEITLIEILCEIGLDTVLIVHQKNTIERNGKRCEAIGNDASNIGDEGVDELIAIEYFEAFEFKNMKNEVFNNQVKQKHPNGELRFITGSDCHEWIAYPKHDMKSTENEFKPTILKCLPTFRGLAFAITDDSRISFENNFFTALTDNYIEAIDLELWGQSIHIPLSKGINVIIGDNSIGKSLLLHKLTGYLKLDASSDARSKNLKEKYNQYLEKIHLSIITKIDKSNILRFDSQGEIRNLFLHNQVEANEYFKKYFPNSPAIEKYRKMIEEYLERLIRYLKKKFEYENNLQKITQITIYNGLIDVKNIVVEKVEVSQLNTKVEKIKSVIRHLENIISEVKKLIEIVEENDDLNKILNYFEVMNEQNKTTLLSLKKEITKLDCIQTAFNKYEEHIKKINSSSNNAYTSFEKIKESLCAQIYITIKSKKELESFPCIDLDEKIPVESRRYMDYFFVKKAKTEEINRTFFMACCCSAMKGSFRYERFESIDYDDFVKALKNYTENKENPYLFFKQEVLKYVDEKLEIISSISKDRDNLSSEESSGENTHIYFDVYSHNNETSGIYLIDQPEDDVSPKSIKEYLLEDFRAMRKDRQIIMITHNPQFVVNLDVDNVICMQRDKDNKGLVIRSGALEYEDSEYSIIQLVAELLDGGVELIKKRWKRYEKSNSF